MTSPPDKVKPSVLNQSYGKDVVPSQHFIHTGKVQAMIQNILYTAESLVIRKNRYMSLSIRGQGVLFLQICNSTAMIQWTLGMKSGKNM